MATAATRLMTVVASQAAVEKTVVEVRQSEVIFIFTRPRVFAAQNGKCFGFFKMPIQEEASCPHLTSELMEV